MTVLVFVVTKALYVPISVVPGQIFDAGDIMIFMVGWTVGPPIGRFAGGIGFSSFRCPYGRRLTVPRASLPS